MPAIEADLLIEGHTVPAIDADGSGSIYLAHATLPLDELRSPGTRRASPRHTPSSRSGAISQWYLLDDG